MSSRVQFVAKMKPKFPTTAASMGRAQANWTKTNRSGKAPGDWAHPQLVQASFRVQLGRVEESLQQNQSKDNLSFTESDSHARSMPRGGCTMAFWWLQGASSAQTLILWALQKQKVWPCESLCSCLGSESDT